VALFQCAPQAVPSSILYLLFYTHTGALEAHAFNNAVTDWEKVRYFERI
jgi:hypothetical protein